MSTMTYCFLKKAVDFLFLQNFIQLSCVLERQVSKICMSK